MKGTDNYFFLIITILLIGSLSSAETFGYGKTQTLLTGITGAGWQPNNASETNNYSTTGNVTASYFVGDGSQLTGTGSNYYPTNVNLTSGTYDGDLGGYSSANAVCDAEYTGSHLCTEFEIASWFANKDGSGITGDAWIIAGSPKYAPASLPVNDCNGFTHGVAGSYLGNYWHFNTTEMGDGRAINCGSALKLACCTY